MLAVGCGDPLLETVTLGRVANLETLLGVGSPAAALAEALLGERGLPLGSTTHAVNSPRNFQARRFFWQDEPDAGRPLLLELRSLALDTDADDCRPNVCLYLARVELRAGNVGAARGYADEALELAESARYPQVIGGALSVRALVAATEGELDAARALIAESEPFIASVCDVWHTLHNRVTLGLIGLSAGDYGATLEATRGLAEEVDRIGVAEPGVFPFEGDAIEAAVGLGEFELAKLLIERLERRPRPRTLAVAARGRALLLASRKNPESALDEFERALTHHRELADPLEHGRTLLARGAVLRQLRRKREALVSVGAAHETFERIGAAAFAGRSADELHRLGGRRRSTGLTPTETRVARLVADGLSNKEAAARLVVSVSAVEAHLTRIYAKLGIRSRFELVRSFTQRDPA